jgi:hypothetical protein
MKKIIILVVLVVAAASVATAQAKTRVRFPSGASSVTVNGTVRGDLYHDYVVKGIAGQTIHVKVDGNIKCVFTVFNPDGSNLDMGIDREFSSELPVSGDYEVRVLITPSLVRRGMVANYKLAVSMK